MQSDHMGIGYARSPPLSRQTQRPLDSPLSYPSKVVVSGHSGYNVTLHLLVVFLFIHSLVVAMSQNLSLIKFPYLAHQPLTLDRCGRRVRPCIYGDGIGSVTNLLSGNKNEAG